MNAFAPLTEGCPQCGAGVPPTARFCPDCGAALGDARPPETSPISYRQAEPRWFGVAPPQLLLATGLAGLVLAVVLFATGNWPYGLILLGVGALLLAAFLEAARRRPERHAFVTTWAHARARAQATIETLRAATNSLVAKLAGVADRNAAEKGKSRRRIPALRRFECGHAVADRFDPGECGAAGCEGAQQQEHQREAGE